MLVSSLSSVGSGGSGLLRSRVGSRGRGFNVEGSGRGSGVVFSRLLDSLTSSIRSGMMRSFSKDVCGCAFC